jgi:molybdopterin-biosynthesis enzyme MoeA-like protein
LKGIFEQSLRPFLRETFGGGLSETRTVMVREGDETLIEPVLSLVTKQHPGVYVKSLAKTRGASELRISLTAVGDDRGELQKLLCAALEDLCAGLDSNGFSHRQA